MADGGKLTVLIDPGHGGKFPGACANGLREAEYVLDLAFLLSAYFRSQGHVAFLTRDRDTNLGGTVSADLEARCEMEKTLRPDLFLSLHCNAAENKQARGFEVWTSPGQTESDRAAEEIVKSFQSSFPYENVRKDLSDGDSDKEARFRVLVGTSGPAVLIEFGFLTNPEESLWLRINRARLACVVGAGAIAWWEEKHGSP